MNRQCAANMSLHFIMHKHYWCFETSRTNVLALQTNKLRETRILITLCLLFVGYRGKMQGTGTTILQSQSFLLFWTSGFLVFQSFRSFRSFNATQVKLSYYWSWEMFVVRCPLLRQWPINFDLLSENGFSFQDGSQIKNESLHFSIIIIRDPTYNPRPDPTFNPRPYLTLATFLTLLNSR